MMPGQGEGKDKGKGKFNMQVSHSYLASLFDTLQLARERQALRSSCGQYGAVRSEEDKRSGAKEVLAKLVSKQARLPGEQAREEATVPTMTTVDLLLSALCSAGRQPRA